MRVQDLTSWQLGLTMGLTVSLSGLGCIGKCEEKVDAAPQTVTVGAALSRVTVTLPGIEAPASSPATGDVSFTRYAVDNLSCGAGYTSVTDMDGDGQAEILVSRFGPGGGSKLPYGNISVYRREGGLEHWTGSPVLTEEEEFRFPNIPSAFDVDGDGDLDVLAPMGFFVCEVVPFNGPCGALAWYEQTGAASSSATASHTASSSPASPSPAASGWQRHDLVPYGGLLFYHDALMEDLDHDGRLDLITVGERRQGDDIREAFLQMFRGVDTADRFEKTPINLAEGLGSLFRRADLDGDGDSDFYSAEYFNELGSFAWVEQVEAPSAQNPAGKFERHVIADDLGLSIHLRLVPNLLGDGRTYAVGTNHTNTTNAEPDLVEPGVFLFTIPEDVRQPWPYQVISGKIVSEEGKGRAAPGVFDAGDVDGDGDIDLIVSGDGDPRIFWLEQSSPGTFDMRVLDSGMDSVGGISVTDLDGDGRDEIVVPAYSANAVFLYQLIP